MNPIPNRPAISDVLIRASSNINFRVKLLTSPQETIAELNLPPEDARVLSEVRARTLPEYAQQVKVRLMAQPF